MKQLAMKATLSEIPERKPVLPDGYKFVVFSGDEKDLSAWKKICMEPPTPSFDGDEYYRRAIINKPVIVPTRDIWFIANPADERVATITTMFLEDGTGHVHMVKALLSERGKGLGKALPVKALEVFRECGKDIVTLTTDDFRLPAIKTYLDAGFKPIIYHDDNSDMKKRWDDIINTLGYTKEVGYLYEDYK